MARTRSTEWQSALVFLTACVTAALAVTGLYWAQAILVPLGLAIFLSFLLTPLVTALQRYRVPKSLAVVTAVAVAALFLVGVGWIVVGETKSLAADLPRYTDHVKSKLATLQEWGKGSVISNLEAMVEDIAGPFRGRRGGEQPIAVHSSKAPEVPIVVQPSPVVVEAEAPLWTTRLLGFVSPVLETLAQAALSVVLVIFILLKREDLRNRLIRLMGHGRITETTKALDDAGRRISRYLLVQLLINTTYGLAFGLGLSVIGFQHALLWGFLAGVLRYVPYVGTWISTAVVVTLSLAMFPGWTQALFVVSLIAVLELTTYNVIEPWLFSQSIGVSEVALLLAAAFWAFLWGPIGLILSGPLTVCLVILGEYVPQLEFLSVLLGDEQALEPDVSFYQRLSARDQDEAVQIVFTQTKSKPPERVYDDLLVPALTYAKRDKQRGLLEVRDEEFILNTIRELIDDLPPAFPGSSAQGKEEAPEKTDAASRARLLCCPAHDKADHVALEMLQQLLDPAKWEIQLASPEVLTAEVLNFVAKEQPGIVCIGSLPPGGLAHSRYLCKRLRARFPDLKIMVGRWGLKAHIEENFEQLRASGANHVGATLLDTRDHINPWRPVLDQEPASPPAVLAASTPA